MVSCTLLGRQTMMLITRISRKIVKTVLFHFHVIITTFNIVFPQCHTLELKVLAPPHSEIAGNSELSTNCRHLVVGRFSIELYVTGQFGQYLCSAMHAKSVLNFLCISLLEFECSLICLSGDNFVLPVTFDVQCCREAKASGSVLPGVQIILT